MIQPYLFRWSVSSLRIKIIFVFIICICFIALITVLEFWKSAKLVRMQTIEKQLQSTQIHLLQATAYEAFLYNYNQSISTPDQLNSQKAFINQQVLLKQIHNDLEIISIESQEQNYPIGTHIDSLLLELEIYEGLLKQLYELKNQKTQDHRPQEQLSQVGYTLTKENEVYQKVDLLQNEKLTVTTSLSDGSAIADKKVNIENYNELFVQLYKQRELLNSNYTSLFFRWNNTTEKTYFQGQFIFAGIIVTALLGSTLLYLFLNKTIIEPINSLNTHVTKVVESGPEKQKPALMVSDEIGDLTNNIHLLVHYQRSKLEELTEKTYQLTQQNQALQSNNQKLVVSEQELLKLHTVKDKFFSILSHDLKGPLHTLSGFLGILKGHAETFTVKELQDFAQEMDKSVGRLLELLSNLLRWSLAQTGNITYKPVVLSIHEAIINNIALLSETAKFKSVRLTYQENKNEHLKVDKDMLDFILRNLLTNAIKFSHENGLVQVKTEKLDTMLAITVCDNGIGIGEDEIKKLFQPQHHFSTPGTAKEKGTGFGLLLCKEFVNLHGGSILINSKLEEGTSITFTLPLADC